MGVDVVIHLAARVHVMHDRSQDPLAAFMAVNAEGTRQLAEQAAAAGASRFIFVSSATVNGEQTRPGSPYTVADAPSPKDPYGESKWEAEKMLHEVASRTGLEIVIVRPPLVYGRDVKANFARLIGLVRRGVPLPLGAVDNRRSLVGLNNLVDLLVRCVHHPRAAGQTFLVSDGDDLSTPSLIRELGTAMGCPAKLFPVPVSILRLGGRLLGRTDEIGRLIESLQMDIRHTCETLEWRPPFSVQSELLRAVSGAP
jgi:nucleoside-diphosphate-sugar epimerase